MKLNKWVMSAAFAVGVLAVSGQTPLAAWQDPATPADIQHDRVDRNRDNRDIHKDKKAIRQDRREVRKDLNHGHYRAAQKEVGEIKRKEHRLDKDQKDRNRDNRDIQHDKQSQ